MMNNDDSLPVSTGAVSTLDRTISGGGNRMQMRSTLNVGGGSTTYTFTNGNALLALYASEFSGLAIANAFDQNNATFLGAATSHPSGVTPNTIQADELLISAFNGDGSGATVISIPTDGGTWTLGDSNGSDPNMISGVAFRIVAATGAYQGTWTLADPADGISIIGTYKAAAAAAAKNPYVPYQQLQPILAQ